ncbi:hydrogenase maturation protease [Corynebacterium breve]|uniref:Hydrogenase maturation protease n=1 Tax=Corynebacterium breve TaxID=3049799 RepID=A0ABY8VGS4_9CORY|nr:hydrogenase maturation protease [Corynebacterium breve]WIM68282.1 hydrogenase maturation protease [Corynebacterium breve]
MAKKITAIGIGNPIMADDGVGLAILNALASEPLGDVEYIDGGTSGMELLPDVQDADRLLILDGIKGPTPGEVRVVAGDQIKILQRAHLSPHQVGLLDLLTAARLLGKEPAEVVVVGVVAQEVDLQVGLNDVVAQAVPEAVGKARAVLESWVTQSVSTST